MYIFKVADTHSGSTQNTIPLEAAPWACGWSPTNSHDLFVGCQSGAVLIYDLRNTQVPKISLTIPGKLNVLTLLVF